MLNITIYFNIVVLSRRPPLIWMLMHCTYQNISTVDITGESFRRAHKLLSFLSNYIKNEREFSQGSPPREIPGLANTKTTDDLNHSATRTKWTLKHLFAFITRYLCGLFLYANVLMLGEACFSLSKVSFATGLFCGLLSSLGVLLAGVAFAWTKFVKREEKQQIGTMDVDEEEEAPLKNGVGVVPPGASESCEWFNILFQKILREHFDSEVWRTQYQNKLQKLFNPKGKPEFIGDVVVEKLTFGSNRIQLNNIRLLNIPAYNLNTSPADEKDMTCEFDLKYYGNSPIIISISTMVYINWPVWHLAHFPIAFDICIDHIEGRVKFNCTGGMDPIVTMGFLRAPISKFRAASSMGSIRTAFNKDDDKSKFRIPKVSSYLIKKLQAFLAKEMVVPEGVCCNLPVKGLRPLRFKLLKKWREQQGIIEKQLKETMRANGGPVPFINRATKPMSNTPSPQSSSVHLPGASITLGATAISSSISEPASSPQEVHANIETSEDSIDSNYYQTHPYPVRQEESTRFRRPRVAPPRDKPSPATMRRAASLDHLPLEDHPSYIDLPSSLGRLSSVDHLSRHHPTHQIHIQNPTQHGSFSMPAPENRHDHVVTHRSSVGDRDLMTFTPENVRAKVMNISDPFSDVPPAPSYNRANKPEIHYGSNPIPISQHANLTTIPPHSRLSTASFSVGDAPYYTPYQPATAVQMAPQIIQAPSHSIQALSQSTQAPPPTPDRSKKPAFQVPEAPSSITFTFGHK
ncbi:hypothetical protein PROFUN_15577 [Planoprotostelium fungivorum]|uniref:SMP-LTD domain-containing protein n=1 Tax=Planoprotostelium fungivorum TaxID=1890364 RepID=A0A2P6MRJ6_9EUKA|nr:hypothetical protein PROFUN_15577 [Planoprotostelium fungivorum]